MMQMGNQVSTLRKVIMQKEQTVTMRKLIGNYFQDSWLSYCEVTIYPDTDEDYEEVSLQTPKNRTYLFAMSTENLKEYINDYKIGNRIRITHQMK